MFRYHGSKPLASLSEITAKVLIQKTFINYLIAGVKCCTSRDILIVTVFFTRVNVNFVVHCHRRHVLVSGRRRSDWKKTSPTSNKTVNIKVNTVNICHVRCAIFDWNNGNGKQIDISMTWTSTKWKASV